MWATLAGSSDDVVDRKNSSSCSFGVSACPVVDFLGGSWDKAFLVQLGPAGGDHPSFISL